MLRIDNTTAKAHINKMGGVQVPKLYAIAREMWDWCAERGLWIFASYIASRENIEADRESGQINQDIEWELAPHVFRHVTRILGEPQIDLFASRHNHKCARCIP